MEEQKCKYHQNKEAIRNCSVCNAPLCEHCIQLDGRSVVCEKCLNSKPDNSDDFDYSSIELDINDYVGNIDMSDVEETDIDIDIDIDDILKEVEEATKEAREQNKQAREQTKELKRQTKEQTKEIKRQTKEQTKEIKRQVKENVKQQTREIKKQVKDTVDESVKKYNNSDENVGYNKYYNNQKGYSDTVATLLSFIPGASQMYLGLMNRGLLICFLFCISLFLLHIPLVYVPIWIASVFDARKIRKQTDQGVKVKDDTSDIVKIISNPYVILTVVVMVILEVVWAVVGLFRGMPLTGALESALALCVILAIVEYRKKKRGK